MGRDFWSGGDHAHFMAEHWHKRLPAHLPSLWSPERAAAVDLQRVRGWLRPPVTVNLHELGSDGSIVQTPVPPASAFERFTDSRDAVRPTLFAYRLHMVDRLFSELLAGFAIGYGWRHTSHAATISSPGGSVGLHADIMDVVLVQARGRRRWRVFPPAATPEVALAQLGAGRMVDWSKTPRPRGDLATLECELSPGDGLYIPALWAHEGVTLDSEPSVSLSFGWYGYTPHIVLAEVAGDEAADRAATSAPHRLFRPIDDPLAGVNPAHHYVSELCAATGVPPSDGLRAAVWDLVTRGPRRTRNMS